MAETWMDEWIPMMEAVGEDFSDGSPVWGADAVEQGAVRRFLEPLEFDCPLHYDKEIAKKYGYDNIIAPYSSLLSWTIPPLWSPGQQIFTSPEKNAQPEYSPLTKEIPRLGPKTSGYFATDIDIDYLLPIHVGDRLCQVGNILLSCVPKETSVGRGAFVKWKSKIQNQHLETVAILRIGMYYYNPQ